MEHAQKPQEENEPYICPHCQKTFSFLCHYKRHLVIHSQDRPHKCELCASCLNGKTIYGITFEGDTENRLHLAATRKRNYKMLLYKLFVTSAVI